MMTGKEFEVGMKRLGYSQIKLADRLGVHRDTIAARCKAPIVDELYRCVMLGMLAEQAAGALILAVGSAIETN